MQGSSNCVRFPKPKPKLMGSCHSPRLSFWNAVDRPLSSNGVESATGAVATGSGMSAAGATVAGRDSHPLKNGAFPRRTQKMVLSLAELPPSRP